MVVRPPGPRSWLPGAPLLAFRRDPLRYLAAAAREHGDVVYVKVGPRRFFMLAHPDAVKDVLVTHHRRFTGLAFEAGKRIIGEGLLSAQGDAHRRQRRLLQPAFHRDRIAGYAATMVKHGERWSEGRRDGDLLAVRDQMMRLTLGVVGDAMFGAGDSTAADDVRELIDSGMALFGPLTFAVARFMERLPTRAARRFVRARARLDRRVYAMLDERRASGEDRGDLLSMLIAALDAEGGGGGFTDRQVRDEVVTIFLAGHETTASALTWSWHLLAQNPDAEARMHAELDGVVGDRPPTAADLPRLTYTAGVFAEALRLFPTVPLIFRRALEEHPVGEYVVPRGGIVVLSQYVVHRDARFYEEPERFEPERWLPEAKSTRPRFAYFPFGGGPRVCIGEGFAATEGTLLLAAIGRRWRLAPVDGGAPTIDARFGTRPSEALHMRLERRRPAPPAGEARTTAAAAG